MTGPLVEKIALAIGGPEGSCKCVTVDRKPCKYCRQDAVPALKAAIEGLMEPSDKACDACLDALTRAHCNGEPIPNICNVRLRAAAEENGIKLEPTE